MSLNKPQTQVSLPVALTVLVLGCFLILGPHHALAQSSSSGGSTQSAISGLDSSTQTADAPRALAVKLLNFIGDTVMPIFGVFCIALAVFDFVKKNGNWVKWGIGAVLAFCFWGLVSYLLSTSGAGTTTPST